MLHKFSWFYAAGLLLAACNRPVKGENGLVYSSAMAYNEYIVSRQAEIAKLSNRLSVETKNDLEAAERTIDSAVVVLDKDLAEIEGMPAWKGDTLFRNSALALFRFYKQSFSNNYRRIIAIQKDGNLTRAEKEGATYLMEEANKTESQLDTDLKKAQQQFGMNNGLIQKKE